MYRLGALARGRLLLLRFGQIEPMLLADGVEMVLIDVDHLAGIVLLLGVGDRPADPNHLLIVDRTLIVNVVNLDRTGEGEETT